MPTGLRIGSLFSGIGGLDLACEWAWPGASTAWQLDQVNAAVRRRHWPDALQVEADVTTVDPLALPAVDVLCGGFPCQDLSVAGKQAGLDGERSELYREVLRFTGAIRPRFVVCENVSGLLPYMPRLAADFRALGYGLSYAVCEAADAGHPHLRRRVFELAEREWPTTTAGDAKASGSRCMPGSGAHSGTSLTDAVRPDRWTPDDLRPWDTPRANPGGSGRRGGARSHEEILDAQVRTWGTLSASNPNEGEDPASWHARAARLKEKGINGNGAAEPLGQQVRTWGTPSANESGTGKRGPGAGRGSCPRDESITGQVRTWNALVATDSKGSGPRQSTSTLGRDVYQVAPEVPGERLNPAWVECLMGYPPGWTEPTGQRLECRRDAPAVRGRYPASWDRSVPWPGYAWEPPRTIPDGPALPGRPARVKACGNAVCPQQGALALEALLRR